jgi:hypothetical protein
MERAFALKDENLKGPWLDGLRRILRGKSPS